MVFAYTHCFFDGGVKKPNKCLQNNCSIRWANATSHVYLHIELVPVMRAQKLPSVVHKGIVFSWVSKTPRLDMKPLNKYDMQPSNQNLKGMNEQVSVRMFFEKK